LPLFAADRCVDATARSVRSATVTAGTIAACTATAIASAGWSAGGELRQVALHVPIERTDSGPSGTANARAESARYAAIDATRHVFVASSRPADPRRADKAVSATTPIAAGTIVSTASAGGRSAARNPRARSGSRRAARAAIGNWSARTDAVSTRAARTAVAVSAGRCSWRSEVAAGDGRCAGARATSPDRSRKLLATGSNSDRRLVI